MRRVVGWLIGILLVVETAIVLGRRWSIGPSSPETLAPQAGNTQALGQILYTRYLFPFEVTSILLLVAMVGAVVIARGRTPTSPGARDRARGAKLPGGDA